MTKQRGKPKYSHSESVAALLAQLHQAAPAASDWLEALRQRALKKDAGWKADADAYVHGLTAAGAITREAAAACREDLARCLGSNPGWREFLLPMAWIAIVAAVAVTCRALASDMTMLAALIVLTAGAGGLWASTRPWLDRRNDPRQGRWERPIVIGACALMVPVLTYLIPLLVGLVIQRVSIEQFNADRAAFVADPQGFPLLRKLAREQYGLEVVLGDADQSWASTTVNLPNASVASMALRPGYCHLSMHRANVLRGFEPVGHVDKGRWVQGVMMHEFAHCLDGSRDMPAFGQRTIGTRSLAPMDATNVQDIQGFLEAGTHATQLWREAVADTFAVGYWKLTAPADAGDLVASLRRKRTDAHLDTTHATMCWIDHAEKADLPASTADLFTWADRLRASAPCELPKPAPKKLTRLQQWVKDWL
jgi:hypothetical protein